MTRQATAPVERDERELRSLLAMTALTLALLGAVAAWQLRPGNEQTAATLAVGTPPATVNEGAPRGGLAERYAELEEEAAAQREARVTTRGGLAELWAEQVAARAMTEAPVMTMGDLGEREQELAWRTSAP